MRTFDSTDYLAECLYEGKELDNLAEVMARRYGKAQALSFYDLMGEDVQNFWRGIAKQLIDHAKEWECNEGSCCILSKCEQERLHNLPRVQ